MSGRRGRVLRGNRLAGTIEELDDGYQFTYEPEYLRDPSVPPVSLTMPKRQPIHRSPVLFPCFVALLAEGALADVQCRALRLDERDLFGRVLATCGGDVIGSLRIEPVMDGEA
jgi:serine/threonine-protein kinase HipA